MIGRSTLQLERSSIHAAYVSKARHSNTAPTLQTCPEIPCEPQRCLGYVAHVMLVLLLLLQQRCLCCQQPVFQLRLCLLRSCQVSNQRASSSTSLQQSKGSMLVDSAADMHLLTVST